MQRRQFFSSLIFGLTYGATRPLWANGAVPLVKNQTSSDAPALAVDPQVDREQAARMQLKIDRYNEDFPDDIFLKPEKRALFKQVLDRISRVQTAVGYGRFNLMSFDGLLKIAAEVPEVGLFSQEEMHFIEEIFFTDAKSYGFYGEKVTDKLTTQIREKDTIKIAGSGHYLFRGRPEALYREITRDVGNDIVLTSGIRSVVKQLHLFLLKTEATGGNLSRASRSLAPPGHSFHGVSDFDVGKTGWGYRNFSDQFAESDVFKRLTDLGYVDIRYTRTNTYGVRFEPWHIKVST